MILLALGAIILVASAVQCSSMFFDEVDLYYEREEGTATAIVATSIPTPTYLTARAIEIPHTFETSGTVLDALGLASST